MYVWPASGGTHTHSYTQTRTLRLNRTFSRSSTEEAHTNTSFTRASCILDVLDACATHERVAYVLRFMYLSLSLSIGGVCVCVYSL